MSAALLKKSLELVDTPYERKEVLEESDKPFKYTLIKPLNKDTKKQKTQRGVADFRRRNKNTVEKVKRSLKNKKDLTEEYLKKLALLKRPGLDKNSAKIIFERLRNPFIEEKAEVKEESTAFTEEDFQRFEKEYIDS